MRRIVSAFARATEALCTPVFLLDAQGNLLHPANAPGLPTPPQGVFARSGPVCAEGYAFLGAADGTLLLAVPWADGAPPDTLPLAAALIEALAREVTPAAARMDALRALLKGDVPQDVAALAKAHQMQPNGHYCAIALICPNADAAQVRRVVQPILCAQRGGFLTDVDVATVACVTPLGAKMPFEDVVEMASALSQMLETEAGHVVTIGVSDMLEGLHSAPICFAQALCAARVGALYRPGQGVYVHKTLLLERFIDQVDPALRDACYRYVFSGGLPKWYNEEMAQTVDKFFENNLNLSETARQLFIHRNTLVYRLDKIAKATDLDLRVFDDAVMFKALLLMERAQDG